MKILFITACAVEERYLIEQVAAKYPDTHVLRPMYWESDRPAGVTVTSASSRISQKILEFRARLAAYYFKKKLFGRRIMPLPKNLREVSAWKINSPEVAAVIRELAPDVIISSDAPILKPEIYSQAKLLAFNIHWGIAPQYRGNHTNFWALYKRDFANIGVTLHGLSDGIDRGGVLSRIYPALTLLDHEFSITTQLARMVPGAVLDLLSTLESKGSVQAQPQTEKGTLFLARHQTLAAVLRCTLKTFFLRPRSTEARISRFF